MKKILLYSALGLATVSGSMSITPEAQAQSLLSQDPSFQLAQADNNDPYFLTRAKNLARQAAEQRNGGLNNYRAEASMYGPAIDSPHVENDDGSITFSFRGGEPGFIAPTIETVATVTSAGLVNIEYNGPVRPVSVQPQPVEPDPALPSPSSVPGIVDQIQELIK